MSSDGNGPDIPQQRPGNASWGQTFEHTHQGDHDALPPLPASGEEEAFDYDLPNQAQQGDNWHDESNQQGWLGRFASPLERLKQLGQQLPLVFVPLLFLIIVGLLVIPLIAAHKAYIAPAGLVPIIIVLLIATAIQAISASYAGSNRGLWALATLGGFSLFLLIAIFALFGPVSALVTFFILVLLFVVIIRLYFHPVSEGYVDIVYAFGKYTRTLYPGANVLLPWEKVGHSLNVGEKQWVCPLQKVQLSRDEDVVLRATISYQLMPEDAYLAVTQVNQWEEILKELVVSTIQSIATTFTPDDFIAWPQGLHSRPLTYDNVGDGELRWERINAYLHQLIRDRVALWGGVVNWVRIRDVSLAPHGASIVETDAVFDTPTTIIEKPVPAPQRIQRPPTVHPVSVPVSNVPVSQSKSANSGNIKVAEDTTLAVPLPQPQPTQADPSPLPAPPLNEKVLIEAYKTVQDGKIKDPSTIRTIAAKFETIAQDPEARNTVSFDAERAAQILYARAQKYEASNTDHDEETKPDWVVRRPNDENLMAGG